MAVPDSITTQNVFEMLMESQYWPADRLLAYQRSQLEHLLKLAREHTRFYKTRLDPVFRADGSVDWDRWSEIPILTRKDLQDHRDDMQTDVLPAIHAGVQDFWSSGTTGMPVTVTHTVLSSVAAQAASFRAAAWTGIDWRKNAVDCSRGGKDFALYPEGALSGAWGPDWHSGPRGESWRINRQVTPEQLCRFLIAKKARYLTCRPQTAHAAALEALRLGLDIRLHAVIGHGTAISDEEQRDIAKAFGAKTVSVYSSTECTKISHQCSVSPFHHVNAEFMLVEIVDENGRPCPPGVDGRTIITPVLSAAQPLIRYDQGDIARMGHCTCRRTLPVIEKIVGREVDLFVLADGRKISLSVPPALKLPLGTEVWQLAQTALEAVEVRYKVTHEVHPGSEEAVARSIREQMGEHVKVTFRRLAEIPLNANGKFSETVRENF
jgi:phenylacetate-CoA ligase